MDPRGPDQRRKQIVQRLAQQAAATQGAAARVPMPARLGVSMSEGRTFRGGTDGRALGGRTQTTQAPNILQSVLSRLGVLGHSHAEEVSQGQGLPIAPPAHGVNLPMTPTGSAIPTPAQNAQTVAFGTPVSPGGFSGFVNGTPTAISSPGETQIPNLPAGSGGTPNPDPLNFMPGGAVSPTGAQRIGAPAPQAGGDSGPVPLGNGLYYDPATGTILGQALAGTGDAARALPRGSGRSIAS